MDSPASQSGRPRSTSIPKPPPPPPTPDQRRKQAYPQPVRPKPQLQHSSSTDSGVGGGCAADVPPSVNLEERKAEVLDTSLEFFELKKPLDQSQVDSRDKMLGDRNQGIAMLRDLMAQEWVKANAPEIIRALQDPGYAGANNIRIVLVVDGVPVHLAPPSREDQVSPENLKMYQEYVQKSLAQYCQVTPPLVVMARQIKNINEKLKRLDDKLKSFGVKVHKNVEDDMLKNNTVVIVDMSRRDSAVVWGEPGNIPDSGIGRHKSSINGGNVHFIHNSEEDEGGDSSYHQGLQRSDSWEVFDDDRGNVDLEEGELQLPSLTGSWKNDMSEDEELFDPHLTDDEASPSPPYDHAVQYSRLSEEQREVLREGGAIPPNPPPVIPEGWSDEVINTVFKETPSSSKGSETPPLSKGTDV